MVAFQGIKSDGLFNYPPPLNLLALCVLGPLRLVLTPRKFHSLNVFCTSQSHLFPILACTDTSFSGILSGPILASIAIYEGRHKRFLPETWRVLFSKDSIVLHWIQTIKHRWFTNIPTVDAVFDNKHARSTLEEDADLDVAPRRTSSAANISTLKHKKSSGGKGGFALGLGSRPNSPSPASTPAHPSQQQGTSSFVPQRPPIRKRRESIANMFAPPERREPDAQYVGEFRDRLGELESAVNRIESGLNALLESSGHATES